MTVQDSDSPFRRRLLEVAALFLKLGFTAFGGPAAHVAMLHNEVVRRRKWLDDGQFLDLLGATNLIPGPNSTEMAIHIGFLRAGWPGLIAAGSCFILPATGIVMALAWAYVSYGAAPAASALLYGLKPVMIAIIAMALRDLGSRALKGPLTLAVGAAVFILYFLRINELALLFAGGVVVMLAANRSRLGQLTSLGAFLPLAGPGVLVLSVSPFSLPLLFFTFLKIGSVLYGSGYVLLAFMRADFVTRLGWLTDRQLIDAVAVGQVTPGPVFTTATFVGYILGGVPGALLATLGIFLPAFIFVAISSPLIPRMRSSPWAGALLDGIIAGSLGLMAAVTVELGRASLVDPLTVGTAVVSLVVLVRFKPNATWLVLGGGLVGLVSAWLR